VGDRVRTIHTNAGRHCSTARMFVITCSVNSRTLSDLVTENIHYRDVTTGYRGRISKKIAAQMFYELSSLYSNAVK
jgi:hypothetical protein